jgi:chromosome segregation ATPase
MSSEQKVTNTPTRSKTPKTPGTPGTPTNDAGVSNDELLDHLQSRAQVFNQLWQAVEKVQGDSISVATWKAKLKELDDAKAVSKKLKKELQAVSSKNSEFATLNAALLTTEKELRNDIKTRDSRLAAAHAQVAELGKEVEDVRLEWQKSESKVKREFNALKERHAEKIEEIESAQENIKTLVRELQSLKTELLRTKEVGRIESEAMQNDLDAANANIVALNADKDKISAHLWNVTDEIKKLADQLGNSESLREHAENELKTTKSAFNKLQKSATKELKTLNDKYNDLKSKYDENLNTLSELRTKHEQDKEATNLGAKELRENLKKLRSELSTTKESENNLKEKLEISQKELNNVKELSNSSINKVKQELSDERVANRALSERLEKDLAEAKNALQASDHEKSRLQIQLEDRNRLLEEMRGQIKSKDDELQKWQKDLMNKETAKNAVRARLESQLSKNRNKVKELTSAIDNLQVKADAELMMERDRTTEMESKLERAEKSHLQEVTKVKKELNALTEETFRLRTAVSRAEEATEKQRERADNLRAEIDAGEEDMSSVQSELREALEQHVKDSQRAKDIAKKQGERLQRLEEEKREILTEAAKLNSEIGEAQRERTKIEEQLQASNKEKANMSERLELSKRMQDELREELNSAQNRIEALTKGQYQSESENEKKVTELKRELKLTQKEAAKRVARFSEQGRELATEIQRLTLEKRELQEAMQENEATINTKDEKIRELQGTLNDVHKLRDAVGKEAAAMRNTMREQVARIETLEEELEQANLQAQNEVNNASKTEHERKVAERKRKEAERLVAKAEKEKVASVLAVERVENEKNSLRAESKMRKEKAIQLEERIQQLLIDRDRELGRVGKELDAYKIEISELKKQIHKGRDTEDLERARREKLEKKIQEVRSEAHTTIESLMRECQALKTSKKQEHERLTKELEQQYEFSQSMKRERDRQAENSKAAIAAMKSDADTQRRLANLLEKEKTELKKMLQEKWTECQKMSLRVDEITETNAEAMHELDDWKTTKASLEQQISTLEKEKEQMGWRAKETEQKIRAELKETTGRASHLAAEMTSLKHQALWADREGSVKIGQLEREIATMKAALDHKTQEHRQSEKEVENQQAQMRDMQNTSEYTIGLLRKELQETNDRSKMTALEMKRSVEDLRQRTQDAEENVAKMRKELRAKKLQTDSVTRELKHMSMEVKEKSRQLENVEESRTSLLQELERTRGDKTDMVHQVMEARDGAADEASQLARQIQGLNIRVSTLTDELDKSNEMRAKLELNLRKQIMEELQQKGMLKNSKAGATTSGVVISPEKEKQGLFTAELGRDALIRASAERDPVYAMRQLRESLVSQLENDRNIERAHELSRAKQIGAGNTDTTDFIQDDAPLSSTLNQSDQNRRTENFAPVRGTMKNEALVDKREEDEFIPTGNATKDSLMRTERFLEKRRRRERYLQKQIEEDKGAQREREQGYENMVGRKTTSRESMHSRESQRSSGSRGSNRSTSRRGKSRENPKKLPGLKSKARKSKHKN